MLAFLCIVIDAKSPVEPMAVTTNSQSWWSCMTTLGIWRQWRRLSWLTASYHFHSTIAINTTTKQTDEQYLHTLDTDYSWLAGCMGATWQCHITMGRGVRQGSVHIKHSWKHLLIKPDMPGWHDGQQSSSENPHTFYRKRHLYSPINTIWEISLTCCSEIASVPGTNR